MKKFKFTLQTVHTVREMRQEKEETVLNELRAEADSAANRLSEIERARLAAIESYAGRLKKGEAMNPFEIEMSANHLSSLDRLAREAQAAVEQKQQACRRQSQVLAAASREVQITERLRETQQQRHRLEFARREQIAVDELVSANFARRMSEHK